MWGEEFIVACLVGQSIGLPPLVWGEVNNPNWRSDIHRITPTSVGRSKDTGATVREVTGLPPLVWGEDIQNEPHIVSIRITPTSVGRSLYSTIQTMGDKDYPH